MPPKKNTNTGMVNWDEQLAKDAQIAAAMEANTGGGKFFSVRAGVLSFGGNPVPGNQMAVVILDHIMENVYYAGEFDESNPQGPACFAFGRDEKTLTPHQVAVDAGSAQGAEDGGACQGCPMNEWGTANKGKGKACRNTRRLALIPAGVLDANGKFTQETDPEQFKSAEIAYMRLPVTSVKGFATWVKQLAEVMKRPPHGVIAKIKVVPDVKSQLKVTFESLATVPNDIMGVIMERNKEAKSAIDFPYAPFEEQVAVEPKKVQPRRQGPAKIPAQRPTPRQAPAAVKGGRKY